MFRETLLQPLSTPFKKKKKSVTDLDTNDIKENDDETLSYYECINKWKNRKRNINPMISKNYTISLSFKKYYLSSISRIKI